ncbi:amino acid ABC transporter substrate-binding protein [Bosea sp. AAP35]|uniref:amino acid ABC transporter substrate-binding protein n=1 Tax=Bosea sp. AAP35 TaxID=1523417 RepID=UPI0006B97A3D|nr:amino acid ABC transporter substrate-binding protein [Bosea sp. AAP35]KPF69709.1 amino acid ABC transporter substrate-binding protein [Bosea sp. AAP35]MCC5611111.1 amino acid ABC transporter substrate-binding protein [Nostoc sp. CHAB 5834]
MRVSNIKKNLMIFAFSACAAGWASQASAQATLAQVKARGHVNCQVGLPTPGFYALASDGTWSGMDVDMCRGVAAAIFDDPKKVQYQSVTSAVRFTSLANGESDMLSRTTTWTAVRDTQLGLEFAGVNFYDGQGFVVPKSSNIKSAKELNGATVCVLTGTTTELNLADYFRSTGMTFKPVTNENVNVLVETYLGGGCDAYTNDKSGLAARRSAFPKPDEHMILPETISKEPLGPVVRHGDNNWGDIVRWVLFGMIEAEELGVTSANVDEMLKSSNPNIKRLLGTEGNVGEGMGLPKDFMVRVLKHVGNYAETYERNVGAKTPVNIPRDGSLNALWNKGGILYPMPFR